MVYPGRSSYPDPLPAFAGTATTQQTAEQRAALLEFCAEQYTSGRSLREIAGLTDRSQRALSQAEVPLRGPGAPRITTTRR